MKLLCLGAIVAFVGRADECTDFVQMLSPEFEPIRVRLVYGMMQGSAAAQTFVRDSMMPNLRAFIERAIKVRRLPIPLEVTANAFNDDGSSWFRCGSSATRMPSPQIYYDDTDLAVVVSMIADCNGLFMAASPCGSDACGRPTVAGVSSMHYRTFFKFNVIGGVVWACGFTLLGYYLGEIEAVKNNIEIAAIVIVLVSVAPIAIEFFRHRKARIAEMNAAVADES